MLRPLAFLILCLAACNNERDAGTQKTPAARTVQPHLQFLQSNYSRGKQIFTRHCNQCHVAPEKQGDCMYFFDRIFERLPRGEEYFVRFVSDSKQLKLSGDAYAQNLDRLWDVSYEHCFKDTISDHDFNFLVAYIRLADASKAAR